jgi:indole-3-glycerol phosphate synthase
VTYLDELLARRHTAVAARKTERPLETLQTIASRRLDRRDFAAALRSGKPALIAEFKRASPSAGPIAAHAEPSEVAAAYERGGAAALSVLTEPERFGGSFADLRAARGATALPVLCKDFVVDAYQIWEAAAEGADAVLLIVAALDDAQLAGFLALAGRLGMAALVEVHDEGEIERAKAAGAGIVGINNRDLRTFAVDLSTARRLRERIVPGTAVVAESGYRTADDLAACAAAGIDAVLVGEALMRDGDPASAVRKLLAPA